MSAQARVETKATWNDADLIAGTTRAEAHMKTFAGRTQSTLQGLFRRTPDRRAEMAVSGFIADLSQGNVAGAITGISARMTGLGLATGIAVGAGVELFQHFKSEIDETTKASEALRMELDKPLSAQLGLGAEGIATQIDSASKKTDTLIEKSKSWGSYLKNLGNDISLSFLTGQSGTRGVSEGIEKDNITAGIKREEALTAGRAKAEYAVVAARQKSLTVSEAQGEQDKIALEAQQSRSKIVLEESQRRIRPGRSQVQDFKDISTRLGAVNLGENLSKDASQQKSDIKGRELAVQQDLANMARDGASQDSQHIAALKSELGLIQDQLKFSTQLTKEGRQQLQVNETKAKANLQKAEISDFLKPPQVKQAEDMAQANEQNIIKRFERSGGQQNPHFGMSGELIANPAFARSPDAYGGPLDPTPQNGKPYRFQLPTPGGDPSGANAVTKAKESQMVNNGLTKEDMKSLMETYWGGGGN